MNTFLDSTNLNMTLELAGWSAALNAAGHGEGTSAFVGSMADTSVTRSPKFMHKRRRLSRLLDRLGVQIRNNNNYPAPQWLMLNSSEEREPDDVPLDLSVKSETSPPPSTPEFVCPACGQMFTVHDRLAKHIASRHRNKASDSTRVYECEVCYRKFARSDMLTRHSRLHSGVKPYSCSTCGQVFSRSDHLATHQRTHTGEKPYRCPSCPYAACRRDMITRHMRTHSRRPQPV